MVREDRETLSRDDDFTRLIGDILDEPLAKSHLDLPVSDIARAIVSAMLGFEEVASSGTGRCAMIGIHVALVAGAIDPKLT